MLSVLPINPSEPALLLFGAAGIAIFLCLGYACYGSGLSHIPGPAVSRISNLWKLNAAFRADMPRRNIALHRKYGSLVRIGPNMVSVNDPSAISTIYSFSKVLNKTPFYGAAEAWYKAQPLETMITTRNEQYHTELQRVASKAYSTTSAIDMEAQMQPLIDLVLDRLSQAGKEGQRSVDAATMLAHYAFDAVGCVNISEDLGFLRTGTDVGGAIDAIAVLNTYFSVIGQAPWMHKFFLGNSFAQKFIEPNNIVQNLAIRMVEDRISGKQKASGHDLLARLLEISEKDPSKLTTTQIIALMTTNILAGFTTVAISLRSILYNLSRNREAYLELQQEVDEAFASGALSQPPRYMEATKLKYLDAVVTEGMRMHPATGLVLERLVPEGGIVLAGKQIPAGTVVGINSWVMHANTEVYGQDAQEFRPERWLDSDESHVRDMKRCLMMVSSSLDHFRLLLPPCLALYSKSLSDSD